MLGRRRVSERDVTHLHLTTNGSTTGALAKLYATGGKSVNRRRATEDRVHFAQGRFSLCQVRVGLRRDSKPICALNDCEHRYEDDGSVSQTRVVLRVGRGVARRLLESEVAERGKRGLLQQL